MLTEAEVRSRVREALVVVTPPAPWLASRINESVQIREGGRSNRRTVRGLHISLRLVAAATLVVILVGTAATFLLARYSFNRIVPGGPSPWTPSPSGSPSPTHARGWVYGGPAMVTPTDGWTCCVPFEHTTDGGQHWVDVTPRGVGNSIQPYYLDSAHAWVMVWSGSEIMTAFRTDDGGRTWQRGSPLSIPGGVGDGQIYFLDALQGWLLVNGRQTVDGRYFDDLYATRDGGLNWHLQAVNAAPTTWTTPKFYCYQWCGPMAFISQTTGWLAAVDSSNPPQRTLLVTHDGGSTWKPQSLPSATSYMSCPCGANSFVVFDRLHAMFQISNQNLANVLLVTVDGGTTWVARSLPGKAQAAVGFFDPQHGWAIAGSLAVLQDPQPPASWTSPNLPLPLYRTDDGGVTWRPVQTTLQLQSKDGRVGILYFVDELNGFATRQAAFDQPRQLLKTTDGGRTWTLIGSDF